MQAPNAQGLAGLMSQGRAPQQPGMPQGAPQQGMPSPQKASPMAGLGSVEDRVAAYRGNPQPLQQRYAMSQDLLDLLALQKIKSEKDAAARQMQMAMSQQQAAQGQEPMTVAQQREKEVMDLTKNELAQQRGDTAQQQQAQQQGMLQKLMGGIAAAPGANAAAQPKTMATGGIVAFDDGGDVPEEDPAADSFEDPESLIYAEEERRRAMERRKKMEAERERNMQLARAEGANLRPTMPNDPRLLGQVPPQGAAMRAPAQVGAPAQSAMMRAPAAPAAPAAPTAGIASLAAAKPAAPRALPSTPSDDMAGILRKEAISAATLDPAQVERDRRKEIQGLMEFPEERARRAKYADRLQQMYDQEFDPERQRREGIKQFLIGAGGRRYNELGGGAQAAMGYDTAQRKAQLERLKGIEDVNQGIFGLQKAAVEKGIAGGEKGYEQASTTKRTGLETGRGIYGTDAKSRDDALNREVEIMKANITAESNRIAKEGLNLNRAQSVYATAMGRMQELERKLDDDFSAQNGMLLMAEQSGKLDPAQKNQLDIARTQLQMQKAKIRKELEPVLASARTTMGIPQTSAGAGMSKADKELIEKYSKGK